MQAKISEWVFNCVDPAKLELARLWAPDGWEPRPICIDKKVDGVEFIDGSKWIDALPRRFQGYCNHPRERWALGTKLIMPMVFGPGYLYTDDDVILVRDPTPLCEDGPWGEGYGFDRWGWDAKTFKLCELIGEVFECEFTPDEYNATPIDCGVYWAAAYPEWERYMHRFWESPIADLIPYNSNRYRTLDQVFMRAYGTKMGWRAFLSVKQRRVIQQSPEKVKIDYDKVMTGYWVHYCASTHKDKWMQILEDMHADQVR